MDLLSKLPLQAELAFKTQVNVIYFDLFHSHNCGSPFTPLRNLDFISHNLTLSTLSYSNAMHFTEWAWGKAMLPVSDASSFLAVQKQLYIALSKPRIVGN